MRISWEAVKQAAFMAVKWQLTELSHFNASRNSSSAAAAAADSSSTQAASSAPAGPSNDQYRDMMRRVAGTLYQQHYRLKRANSIPPESVIQWNVLAKIQGGTPSEGLSFEHQPRLQHQGGDSRVTAMGYLKTKDENKSRIQFVARPQASSQGLPLFTKVCSKLQHEAIAFWKVMHPQEGCTGPDSAVFYLRFPLGHAIVEDFVKLLQRELQSDAADLPTAPLGLVHIGTGLYATDLPSTDDQMRVLGMAHRDCGSAGTIICSILSQVGQMVALLLDPSQPIQISACEDLIKANMAKLLSSLGWELT